MQLPLHRPCPSFFWKKALTISVIGVFSKFQTQLHFSLVVNKILNAKIPTPVKYLTSDFLPLWSVGIYNKKHDFLREGCWNTGFPLPQTHRAVSFTILACYFRFPGKFHPAQHWSSLPCPLVAVSHPIKLPCCSASLLFSSEQVSCHLFPGCFLYMFVALSLSIPQPCNLLQLIVLLNIFRPLVFTLISASSALFCHHSSGEQTYYPV